MTKSAQNIALKAGQLVAFSDGEHSDYCIGGFYVALKDVPAEEMNMIADDVRAGPKSMDIHDRFQSELVRLGFLSVIDVREIHLGSYGILELT